MRPFRFGYQYRTGTPDELRSMAVDAEAAGFDVVSSWDHVGESWTPLLPLLSMAEATTRLRICPMVINNDLHHPVQLAAELSDLDHLTGGRVELGIGAGHAFTEYEALGLRFDPPAVRKERLAEAVALIRRLLDGEVVTWEGDHYRLREARVRRSLQQRVPILVGVNGRVALARAASHADAIGLTALGRTLEDGHRHEVRWQAERIDATVEHIRMAAGPRMAHLELNALVQVVEVTDDRMGALERIASGVEGLSVDDAATAPFLAVGTHDEIADHLLACRRRWGISYFTVRSITDMAPVIARLRGPNRL
jgi:probable F420-dependent oxidoreductase